MKYKGNPRSKSRNVFHHVVNDFISDENFVYFISFPRTGSHWFRVFMELYTGMPSLVQSFTIRQPESFWSYHRHDKDLKEINGVKNVIYLYRDPINTIYSQISYENESIEDSLEKYIEMYSNHLIKWIFNNKAENIVFLTYEGLKSDYMNQIKNVLLFLQLVYGDNKSFLIDEYRISNCYNNVKKKTIKQLTGESQNVINLKPEYENNRDLFKLKYSEYILDRFKSIDKRLNLWTA